MLALLLLVIIALAVMLAIFGADIGNVDAVPGYWIAAAVVAVLVALYFTARHGHDGERASRARTAAMVVTAAAIATALWLLSPLKDAVSKLPAQLTPPSASDPSGVAPASVRLRAASDGTFRARCAINATPVTMLVDTGAAAVVLKASDAEQAGIDTAKLSYDTALATGNGQTYVAPARIRTLTVGDIRLDDVEAFVAKPGTLNENLLGQSFLRRLASYQLSGDFLTLRQ